MQENISIEEINELEVKRICKDTNFSKLRPVACYKCGNKKNFARRLFKIKGVTKNRRSDDEIQGLLAHHFKKKYLIEHIFFKTFGNEFLIDSAICDMCKSTAITYDIELTPDLLSEISKLIGKDGAK
jgi:hypothetical protein